MPDIAGEGIFCPHAHLPKPEALLGIYSSPPDSPNDETSNNQKFDVDVLAIGKLIWERSNNFSAVFVRRLSSLKDHHFKSNGEEDLKSKDVTEFNLSDLKVTVKLKSESDDYQQPHRQGTLNGRISFFSRSNCRDCTAVRRFLREKRLKFVEINIDVYPNRQKELVERTGSKSREMVEVIIQHLDCGRQKAVEIGRQLTRKHLIHYVFGENDFEDGNYFYRFFEHRPFIPKCFNFWGSINDCEPKPTAKVGQSLTKIMSTILESYASDDNRHLDYICISNSEEFRR